MPPLVAGVEAGTLVRWLKRPGDAVARGDVIAIVDTDEATIEVDVPASVFDDAGDGFDAVIDSVHVNAGDRIPPGTLLALIRRDERRELDEWLDQPARYEPPVVLPSIPASAGKRRSVSPMAQKLAADLGVNLDLVIGTGPEGAITSEDVQRADAALDRRAPPPPPPAPPPVPPPPPRPLSVSPAKDSDLHAAIAASLVGSRHDAPHHHVSTTIDLSAALSSAERRKVPPIALLVKAVGLALRDAPELNGYWLDGGFRSGTGIHVGYSCPSRGQGRVAPAVLDVDRLDLETLAHMLADLATRAQSGSLRSSELSSPTITVVDFTDEAVDATFGTVFPPQVALVGFGRIAERPWVVAGRVEARPLLTATLSVDQRATDGPRAALLLAAIDRLLQRSEQL
jgi:pyruvate dehydrogenase E2 component (dihydrolipoamide acetyltransferase)